MRVSVFHSFEINTFLMEIKEKSACSARSGTLERPHNLKRIRISSKKTIPTDNAGIVCFAIHSAC